MNYQNIRYQENPEILREYQKGTKKVWNHYGNTSYQENPEMHKKYQKDR